MSKKKNNGEVFTPKNIINYMLDKTYKPSDMDYILEPGCGDGRYIIEIMERIIESFKGNNNLIEDKISKIYGIELDVENYIKTTQNIQKFLSKYPFIKEQPKILNDDALLCEIHEKIKWSYIIGNPPYVRIHNLEPNYLNDLKNKYVYLQNGMVDLYYGFFELHKKLKDDGVLCFITPSSYLYNTSGEFLFEDFYNNKLVSNIVDFTSEKMFGNASTYTCITTIKKNSKILIYQKSDKNFNIYESKEVNFSSKNVNFIGLIQSKTDNQVLFKNKFKVKTGFATLSDSIFVINEFIDNGDTITFIKNKVRYTIEKNITKMCVKASKYNGNFHRVIFPYTNVNGINTPMTENYLQENYPMTFSYMNTFKSKLLSRDKGKIKKDKWFLWGRTQGINNTSGNKLIISPIYLNTPFTFINEDVLVYSGYYIIMNKVDKIFKDEIFIESLKSVSKPMASGWKSLQKKILDNVYF